MHETSALSFVGNATFNFSASILRALAHPLRIKILNHIGANQPVNVNRIFMDLAIDQSITSQHLRILKDASLVTYRRVGKEIFYSLHHENLRKTAEVINSHFKSK